MNENLHEQILEYIDKYLHPLLFYEILQLKTETAINLIARVIKASQKTVPEAVLVFLTVVKNLWDTSGSLLDFIKENSDHICKLAIEKKGQSNHPGRALPLFEIFDRKLPGANVSVIELGASYGLIGRCLLNPVPVTVNKDLYFPEDQQMPRLQSEPKVRRYLGIELTPPDQEWILAWEWFDWGKDRLEFFLEDISVDENFTLLKENAFGFSKLAAVEEITGQNTAVVVLTSFMLYQLEEEKQKQLTDEIREFTKKIKGHWINQTFVISTMKCYIEWDGERIIEPWDDECRKWKWLI